MRFRPLIPVIVLLLTAAACRQARLDEVELGMSPAQVEKIAGRPALTDAALCVPSMEYYIYAGTRSDMESYVYFVDDKVVQVVERKRTLVTESEDKLAACSTGMPSPSGS